MIRSEVDPCRIGGAFVGTVRLPPRTTAPDPQIHNLQVAPFGLFQFERLE